MAETTEAMAARGARCERCGQPLLMGRCDFCTTEKELRAPTDEAIQSRPPTLGLDLSSPYTKVPAPEPPAEAAVDRQPTLLAVVLSLLVLAVLACGYLVVKVSSLDSKLADSQATQSEAQTELKALQGSMSVLQDDQQSVHRHLDEVAAADPTAVAKRVQPSVYTIEVPGIDLGSGWVAASDHTTATFVTNYHVIASAWEKGDTHVLVYQEQGTRYDGTITQVDPEWDLALVAVTADIPALTQSHETPSPGETIVVIGSALGLDGSVSTGTVAALRDVNAMKLIQFAAPTSPGNSGGPVVNSLGEVIGITTLNFGQVVQGSENAKFAVPVNLVCIDLHVC